MTNKGFKIFKDQMGRQVKLSATPKRIISLVPSQTEFLFYLGLKDEIAGITKFCTHPEDMFRTKTRVGGTKKINFEKIRQINPDLIICNKEENEKMQVEALMKEFPVWVSDIYTLEDAFEMMREVGEITGKKEKATEIISEIENEFRLLALEAEKSPPLSVAYLIWKGPYMVAGSTNFIDFMLNKAGFTNVFGSHSLRYPGVTEEELLQAKPDLILLSSEPYPFQEKHIQDFNTIFPKTRIKLVDGEMFSWYGSRLLYAPSYIRDFINTVTSSPVS